LVTAVSVVKKTQYSSLIPTALTAKMMQHQQSLKHLKHFNILSDEDLNNGLKLGIMAGCDFFFPRLWFGLTTF